MSDIINHVCPAVAPALCCFRMPQRAHRRFYERKKQRVSLLGAYVVVARIFWHVQVRMLMHVLLTARPVLAPVLDAAGDFRFLL